MVLPILATDAAQGLEIKINFQPSTAQIPAGYLADLGHVFGDRGNGFSYGWDMDIRGDARKRGVSFDQRYDTVVQMQERGARTWEIELPTGGYRVFVACGDAAYTDQINTIDVEGAICTDPDGRDKYDEYTATVTVTDGRLTIRPAPGGTKCKLLFLHITRIAMPKAYNPVPATGTIYADTWANLGWIAGDFAASHDVYFGDDANDVLNGAVEETFQGNCTATRYIVGFPGYPYPNGLVPGTTYYWRVDEFDGAHTRKGEIWSFKTIPVVPITDPNLLCWWKFDEILGNTVADYSGYDHFGAVHGATLNPNGRVGPRLGPEPRGRVNARFEDGTAPSLAARRKRGSARCVLRNGSRRVSSTAGASPCRVSMTTAPGSRR